MELAWQQLLDPDYIPPPSPAAAAKASTTPVRRGGARVAPTVRVVPDNPEAADGEEPRCVARQMPLAAHAANVGMLALMIFAVMLAVRGLQRAAGVGEQ